MVRVPGEHLAQELALQGVVGGLETAKQFVQRPEHLLCKLSGNDSLILTAVGKDRGQTLLLRQAEEPRCGQEHVQRGKDGPPGNGRHVCDAEGGVTARFAAGGVDEPQVRVVEQEPDGNLAFAQQPFKAGLRCGLPMALVLDMHGIEVQGPWQALHEHQPGTFGVLRLKLRDDKRGPKSLVVFRQGHFQGRRDLFQVMRLPAEHGLREPPEIPNLWNYLLVLVFWQVSQKTLMVHGAGAADLCLGGEQCRYGNNQTDRLHEAEPFQVSQDFGIACHVG